MHLFSYNFNRDSRRIFVLPTYPVSLSLSILVSGILSNLIEHYRSTNRLNLQIVFITVSLFWLCVQAGRKLKRNHIHEFWFIRKVNQIIQLSETITSTNDHLIGINSMLILLSILMMFLSFKEFGVTRLQSKPMLCASQSLYYTVCQFMMVMIEKS